MNGGAIKRERITVRGIVQGVGFRPFVYNLAGKHGLGGYVLNNPDGVVIEVEGDPHSINTFVDSLRSDAPPLARIIEIKREDISAQESSVNSTASTGIFSRFEIRTSEQDGKPVTLISPDMCVCDDCLKELFDPGDRRNLYPFVNCTNCGPRFSIIRELPYDRPFTTMNAFSMCSNCGGEYHNPSDRRFHAQPNACSVCGPSLRLLDNEGSIIDTDSLTGAIELLKNGRIVAVKGLGGFHLAVDGTNEEAVHRLRQRKHREEKPLALMVDSVDTAKRLAHLTAAEEQALTSRERPIVLVCRSEAASEEIAGSVAPFTPYIGIMLPYTPLHYLMFYHPQAGGDYARHKPILTALVMTSGNISEEPICKDNDEALQHLSGVADAFLVHDRDIYVRCDDTVITVPDNEVSVMRRSRGYAPMPVFAHDPLPQVLAFGGELKNTLCVTDGCRAFVSQHIGDLENLPTLDFFREAVSHFTKILDLHPSIYAYDLHSEYLSTKYFMKLREKLDNTEYTGVGVQHHHAHIASVMAEHGYTKPVIGFAMDGTGYGLDGAVWGGEVLLSTLDSFVRFTHFDYMPLPGGSAAVREPWRMAFSYLRAAYGDEWRALDLPCLKQVAPDKLELLDHACKTGLNCPPAGTLGRLFDAVAGLLDIRHYAAFEGQAAIMLETYASTDSADVTMSYNLRRCPVEEYDNYPVLNGNVVKAAGHGKLKTDESYILDYLPLIQALVENIRCGKSQAECAKAFHNTLIVSFVDVAERAREMTGINAVALSGGCWQNRLLRLRFQALLKDRGFDVLINRQVPVNDGGISLGQAFVAAEAAGK